jgi:hypothetical protein
VLLKPFTILVLVVWQKVLMFLSGHMLHRTIIIKIPTLHKYLTLIQITKHNSHDKMTTAWNAFFINILFSLFLLLLNTLSNHLLIKSKKHTANLINQSTASTTRSMKKYQHEFIVAWIQERNLSATYHSPSPLNHSVSNNDKKNIEIIIKKNSFSSIIWYNFCSPTQWTQTPLDDHYLS